MSELIEDDPKDGENRDGNRGVLRRRNKSSLFTAGCRPSFDERSGS